MATLQPKSKLVLVVDDFVDNNSFLPKPCLPDRLVVEIKRMLQSGTRSVGSNA